MTLTIRTKVFDQAKQEFVDQFIPTRTIKRSGWARAYDAGAVIASHRVEPGSPATVDKAWLVQRGRFFAGSPDTIFSIIHSREGTVDTVYFEAPGEQLDLLESGVYKFTPGSVRVVMHLAGSTDRVGFGVSLEGPEV